jgi:hypothetical protein
MTGTTAPGLHISVLEQEKKLSGGKNLSGKMKWAALNHEAGRPFGQRTRSTTKTWLDRAGWKSVGQQKQLKTKLSGQSGRCLRYRGW